MITRVERTFRHDGIVENLYTSLNFVRNYENEHILSTSLEYKYNTNVKKKNIGPIDIIYFALDLVVSDFPANLKFIISPWPWLFFQIIPYNPCHYSSIISQNLLLYQKINITISK